MTTGTRYQLIVVAFVAAACGSGSAWADSVNQPGFTIGVPLYAELPTGLYVTNIAEVGVRKTDPDTRLSIYTPFFFLQTPWKVAGARIAPVFSPILADVKFDNGQHIKGLYNTYGGVQFTWKLSDAWGAGFRLGDFIKQTNKVAKPFNTFDTRFGLTYLKNGTHFTANFNYGLPTGRGDRLAPQYLNLDVTYSRHAGKFEYGWVGFGSTDTTTPFQGYRTQRQIATGPLLGYDFKQFSLQLRATSDVYQHNYGGKEQRLWGAIAVPLWIGKGG
jgi:hypothetical protein